MKLSVKIYFACAISLLAAACHQNDNPIAQAQQQKATQDKLAEQAADIQTPREAATWHLVQDIRRVHYLTKLNLPSFINYKPFHGFDWSTKDGKSHWEYTDFTAYRVDIQRRADSLRRTGPLDLRDTLYTPAEDEDILENARKFRAYEKAHPGNTPPSH